MNIASRIESQATIRPNQDAVRFPIRKKNFKYTYEKLSFKELDELSSHYANCLISSGINDGDKVLLFVRPSLDFPALTFALFKIGAVPILIDPGMGKKNLLEAIRGAKPDALIAVPEVHLIRMLYKKTFKSIKTYITTGVKFLPGLHSVSSFKTMSPRKPFKTKNSAPDDMAAILFTSGGTGKPKGVVYTHKIFNKQTDVLQEIFSLTDRDIDLPGFPLFSFFTMAMGMTSCIPDMDPSKPAKCNPRAIVQNIEDNQASFVAGSPSIWERVADYCLKENIKLPSVKYVVMFGAPVRTELHEKFKEILPNGTTYTPYGATESLPVANIDGKSILAGLYEQSDRGNGTCIGLPTPGLELKIIKAHDQVIENYHDIKELKKGEIGEIIVRGDVVTPRYLNNPQKTIEAKIQDGPSFWHRMGDMGMLDNEGRLWFHGRKAHRIELEDQVKYSVSCEAIYNKHPQVKRSALVQVTRKGLKTCALVIEPTGSNVNKQQLKQELSKLGDEFSHTKDISEFFFKETFPVDIRHNIKIDRKKLGEMASSGALR